MARPREGRSREAPTPLFMLLMFGTGFLCVVVGVHAALHLEGTDMTLRIAGAVIYFGGVVAMTIFYHVPRNDRLAALDAESVEG